MLAAAELAASRGALTPADVRDRLQQLIVQLGPLPPVADLRPLEVLEAIRRDKKIVAGRLHFVPPTGIGTAAIVDDVTEDDLRGALLALGLR